jgi:hypothetical protein
VAHERHQHAAADEVAGDPRHPDRNTSSASPAAPTKFAAQTIAQLKSTSPVLGGETQPRVLITIMEKQRGE